MKECKICGKSFSKRPKEGKRFEKRKYCSVQCSEKDPEKRSRVFEWDRADDEEKKAKQLQNFYRNLIIRNGCWGYKTSGKSKTYIQIEIGKRKYDLLHRVSYELHYGPIPEDMQVNHLCHNPSCCRPSHLYLGTQKDNIQDQIDRGTFIKGSKHGNAKLCEEQVWEIKSLLKEGCMKHKEIAEIFAVDRSTITDIRRNKTWKHLRGLDGLHRQN